MSIKLAAPTLLVNHKRVSKYEGYNHKLKNHNPSLSSIKHDHTAKKHKTDCNKLNGSLNAKTRSWASMLKSHFADVEPRVMQKIDVSVSSRMLQEKERLERKKQQDEDSIESKIKAAKAALKRRDENSVKMKYERERADARMALEKMGKSVEIYESIDIVKEVERLYHCCRYDNPLEGLGLRLKDDYLENEVADVILDAEEGEILQ